MSRPVSGPLGRQERLEEYAGGRAEVARLFEVPAEEVEPDEHAHHATDGATYTHGHDGGSVSHGHRLTVEWDPEHCEWRGVDLEPDERVEPPVMAVGKRSSKDDPLTEHDVAASIDRRIAGLLELMYDTRVNVGNHEKVQASRYLTGLALESLAGELEAWGVRPVRMDGDGNKP